MIDSLEQRTALYDINSAAIVVYGALSEVKTYLTNVARDFYEPLVSFTRGMQRDHKAKQKAGWVDKSGRGRTHKTNRKGDKKKKK